MMLNATSSFRVPIDLTVDANQAFLDAETTIAGITDRTLSFEEAPTYPQVTMV